MREFSNKHTILSSLFNKYREPFTLFAFSYVRDRQLAEDLFMEAMLEYWNQRNQLTSDLNVPAYVLTIIKNKALNHLRHMHVRHEAEANIRGSQYRELLLQTSSLEACEPTELLAVEMKQIIQKTFQMLPPLTRRIFYLSRVKNYSYKAIAETLHISVKTVEAHISKALKLFTNQLKDYL